MTAPEYEQRIVALTQEHLQQVARETRQAFIQACPETIPAGDIFDALANLHGLDGIHRLTVFFVALFSGEMDSGSITVTQEEYDALGWLAGNFGARLDKGAELIELHEMLGKADTGGE